ncbi:MAG TPA: hypothetical protein VNT54_16100 [Solirubrobacteraceae bacterium]|nr:hypothetical protein [Solirubrobacteraceae bacterium]
MAAAEARLRTRTPERDQVDQEDEPAAECQVTARQRPSPEADDDQRAEQLDEVDDRREQRLDPGRRERGLDDPLALGGGQRATSAPWRLRLCTSAALARLSSATALSEPLRRRFSRAHA